MDGGVEEVDADQGQVGRRLLRLLDQPQHLAVGAELGHAEPLGVGDAGQQDLGHRRLRAAADPAVALEALDEPLHALAQQVVAQVHHEVVVAEEVPGDQHAVGQPERGVLGEVGDLEAPLRPVAHRGADLLGRVADDHADLDDPRLGHLLQPVEQDRLVGHRHQLLGAGVGDGAQAGAGAAGQDQRLHRCRRSSRSRLVHPPRQLLVGQPAPCRELPPAGQRLGQHADVRPVGPHPPAHRFHRRRPAVDQRDQDVAAGVGAGDEQVAARPRGRPGADGALRVRVSSRLRSS